MNLKEVRIQKGFTQQSLASEIGVTDRTVRSWECGDSKPAITDVIKLRSALKINDSELIDLFTQKQASSS